MDLGFEGGDVVINVSGFRIEEGEGLVVSVEDFHNIAGRVVTTGALVPGVQLIHDVLELVEHPVELGL